MWENNLASSWLWENSFSTVVPNLGYVLDFLGVLEEYEKNWRIQNTIIFLMLKGYNLEKFTAKWYES